MLHKLAARTQFSVKDADGDATISQTLDVTIEGGSTFTGGTDADAIQGRSSGNDILVGGGGNDIFVWRNGDVGTDTVSDFTAGNVAGKDVLNIADLLVGEESLNHSTPSTLAAGLSGTYLTVTVGANTTIAIKADGAGGIDQTIVLTGYNTSASNSLQVITDLLTNGNLKVD